MAGRCLVGFPRDRKGESWCWAKNRFNAYGAKKSYKILFFKHKNNLKNIPNQLKITFLQRRVEKTQAVKKIKR